MVKLIITLFYIALCIVSILQVYFTVNLIYKKIDKDKYNLYIGVLIEALVVITSLDYIVTVIFIHICNVDPLVYFEDYGYIIVFLIFTGIYLLLRSICKRRGIL